MAKLTVSKLDAARAQIDAAIEMYFVANNPIAFHTLTAAAYNVLRDLALKDGSAHPFIKRSFIDEYPAEAQKSLRKFLNRPENFFKHADNDPGAVITFDPEITEILLMDACAYFRDKKVDRPKYYEAYKAWHGVPKDGLNEGMKLMTEALREMFRSKGKREFWNLIQPHLTSASN